MLAASSAPPSTLPQNEAAFVPAVTALAHAARRRAPGGLALSTAMVLLLGIGTQGAEPRQTRNWSEAIAAGRNSQTYHEALMRAADKLLRSFKHDKHRAHRLLARSKRNLEAARERRSVVMVRQRSTMLSLAATRSLVSIGGGAAVPATSRAWSALPSAAAVPAAALASPTRPDRQSLASPTVPLAPPPSGHLMERLGTLERRARVNERSLRKVSRRLHRYERQRRSRARHIASLHVTRRAALAQRASAEAGLAAAILSMSRLAGQRALKKTSVRPDRAYDFARPAVGPVTQGYGCTGFALNPARGGCPHFHDGIDIAGYQGTPIRAAAVGVVSYVGWNPWDHRPRAFVVVIAHPGGLETLYAHAIPVRHVKVGQLVRRGEVIAYMGSTGHATGVHLHLEIRRGQRTLDPLDFL
jgi:murein DD-endopeptidase MepM/ murein hydrolase activator NlpD